MEQKETFVMYKSYIDAVNKLPEDKDKLELLLGICNYSMTGVEPIFNSFIAEAIFIAIKPSISNAKSRYQASVDNGKKGGAPKGNNNAKKKQPKTTQEQPNETTQNNLYVDVYVDDDVYVDVDDNVDVYVYEDDNVLITDVCNIIQITPFRSDYTTIKGKIQFQNGTLDDKILSIVKYFEDTFGKTSMSVQDIKNKLNKLQLN